MYICNKNEMSIYNVKACTESASTKTQMYTQVMKQSMNTPIVSVECTKDIAVVRTRDGIVLYKYNWKEKRSIVVKEVKSIVLLHKIVDDRVWYVMVQNEERGGLVLCTQNIHDDNSANKENDIEREKTEQSKHTMWILAEYGIGYVPTSIEKYADGQILIVGHSTVGIFTHTTCTYRKIDIHYADECSKSSKASTVQRIVIDTDKSTACYITACTVDRQGNIVVCAKKDIQDITDKMLVMRVTADSRVIMMREIEMRFANAVHVHDNRVIVVDQKKLAVVSLEHKKEDVEDTETKYVSLGAVIDYVCSTDKNELMAIQGPWMFTKQKLPPQVKKPRYGRK